MTTQEIKDLIASKIAGQGSAVDAGSALPEILNGIVDLMAAPSRMIKPLSIRYSHFVDKTENEAVALMQLTEEQLKDLMKGYYPIVQFSNYTLLALTFHDADNDADVVRFYEVLDDGSLANTYVLTIRNGRYTLSEV